MVYWEKEEEFRMMKQENIRLKLKMKKIQSKNKCLKDLKRKEGNKK